MADEHHKLYKSQVEFSSDQVHEGSPATEFRQRPDRAEVFDFFNQKMKFDDGAEHEIWTFQTATSARSFPAPTVRITEGQLFHGTINAKKKVHTIHWHGIEPDPRNDGVGHTSFEINGSYTYQWRPERGVPGHPTLGTAGTYFYHCHVNTALHVQYGMFGPLIVDPVIHPDYPVSPGARRAFVDGPEYDLDTETLIVPYSVDPRWHTLNHAAGLSGEDAGLDRFEPNALYLLGGELARPPKRDGPWLLNGIRANVAGTRKPTLVRIANANYFPIDMRFTDAAGRPVAMAELISRDGRAYRDTSDPRGPARPPRDMGRPLLTSRLNFGGAQRFDLLLSPPAPGSYRLEVALLHWITRRILATRVIAITAA